jgi:hypothetical protein
MYYTTQDPILTFFLKPAEAPFLAPVSVQSVFHPWLKLFGGFFPSTAFYY